MKRVSHETTTGPYLSAREAATELGVTLPTLYAYVSRGLIRSEPVPGERARRYRAEDVRALRERRAPPHDDPHSERAARLAGPFSWSRPVLASAITLIADGALYYRGVSATELARHASLETAAGLLWQTDYDAFIPSNRPVDSDALRTVVNAMAASHPIDRCIAALAVAGEADDAAFNRTDRGLALTAARITRLLAAIAVRGPEGRDGPVPGSPPDAAEPVPGSAPDAAEPGAPIHAQVADAWGLDAAGADLIRSALVLLADHELNASTFTLRCAASTGANLYECTIAALAALKGPQHGGATTRAARQLDKLLDGDPLARIREQAEAGERFAGFGHPLYRNGDPRAKRLLEALDAHTRNSALPDGTPASVLTRDIPEAVRDGIGVLPNVDYALAAVAHALRLPRFAGIGLFAIGRSIGWAAHAREQLREHALIRPRAVYSGPAPSRTAKGSRGGQRTGEEIL